MSCMCIYYNYSRKDEMSSRVMSEHDRGGSNAELSQGGYTLFAIFIPGTHPLLSKPRPFCILFTE